ncbi:multicopper oxidase family protein [Cellvibrio polysaccharolyticus]|nr:multicopper oxidase family protein [Cellvibrio polysaccharolyticus]
MMTQVTRQYLTRMSVLPLMVLLLPNAYADEDHLLNDPPLMSIQAALPEASSRLLTSSPGREKYFEWTVKYTDSSLWNPATNRWDKVHLRSYQGSGIDTKAPFAAPTIVVEPGDTIRATLKNRLPKDENCFNKSQPVNEPHCFNSTNMHTHGLWINPAGNSDNVLISINPDVDFQYEYNIPADHPAGTFWYHPHRHGSTAIQVASGMAGALIIKGDRQPTTTQNGDLDTLLSATEERILLFQQIQYYCHGEGKNPEDYNCSNERDRGEIESYAAFSPGVWADSGRFTSINGQVQPFIQAKAGQVERWRMIHAGVRDSINLEFRKMKPANNNFRAALHQQALQQDELIEEYCTGEALTQFIVAADGLTVPAMRKYTTTVFQPGYRWDALMVFPEEGQYCVIDSAAPASANVDRTASSRQLLAVVNVSAGEKADPESVLMRTLTTHAKQRYPENVSREVIRDLENGQSLKKFVAHAPITNVDGKQSLVFNINTDTDPAQFLIDGKPYDPARIDRELVLGTSDEWTLTSNLASHPFHIHVNPFEIVAVYDPNGKDVSGPDAIDDFDKSAAPDVQYRGTKGLWKDTLWVKNVQLKDKSRHAYTVVVRTRYQRYIGDFVLHCHILDHEDQGMMQNVRIGISDGRGGIAHGHH